MNLTDAVPRPTPNAFQSAENSPPWWPACKPGAKMTQASCPPIQMVKKEQAQMLKSASLLGWPRLNPYLPKKPKSLKTTTTATAAAAATTATVSQESSGSGGATQSERRNFSRSRLDTWNFQPNKQTWCIHGSIENTWNMLISSYFSFKNSLQTNLWKLGTGESGQN